MRLRICDPRTSSNKILPCKVRIDNKRVRLYRLPTKENLSKKGIALESTSCPLYRGHLETGEHIFLNCNKTKEVRKVVNSWWELLSETESSIEDLYSCTATLLIAAA